MDIHRFLIRPPIQSTLFPDIFTNIYQVQDEDIGGVGSGRGSDYNHSLIGKVDALTAGIGQRNTALFNDLRAWAYLQPRGQNYKVWEWTVFEQALELREHLGSLWDFPVSEAMATARSVAKWTWAHPGVVSHSHDSERQRLRAYLRAQRARQRSHNRDAEIVVWRDQGKKSWREIAKLMSMSPEGVRKAYTRKKQEGQG